MKAKRKCNNIESKWLNLYEEVSEVIVGNSKGWTHEEILERCAEAVDALLEKENQGVKDEYIKL